MRRTVWASVAAVVICSAIVAGAFALSDRSQAQAERSAGRPSGGEVVMLRCAVAGPAFAVTAYQGSSAAPGRKTENCADQLALLARDGFTIQNIGHYDDEKMGFAVYMLVR